MYERVKGIHEVCRGKRQKDGEGRLWLSYLKDFIIKFILKFLVMTVLGH